MIFFFVLFCFWVSLVSPCLPFQSCYLGPGNTLPLEMSIVVAVENASRQPEENTQALLDHLSIVYVATAESESTGKAGALQFLLWGCSSVECALAPGPPGAGKNESSNPFLPACLGFPAPLFSYSLFSLQLFRPRQFREVRWPPPALLSLLGNNFSWQCTDNKQMKLAWLPKNKHSQGVWSPESYSSNQSCRSSIEQTVLSHILRSWQLDVSRCVTTGGGGELLFGNVGPTS